MMTLVATTVVIGVIMIMKRMMRMMITITMIITHASATLARITLP